MEESQENIKVKIAISLSKLLHDSKISLQDNDDLESLNISYSEIADNANLRKATVSDIFNAIKSANSSTLFRIVKAMGYRVSDFASKYDALTESEIKNFKRK